MDLICKLEYFRNEDVDAGEINLFIFIKHMLMQMHITPNRLISDLQKEFNEVFPYLKLEFFQNKNYHQRSNTIQQILPHNKKIAEGQLAITDGDVEIKPEMKVRDLENIFKNQFSLAVQVFRRSGKLWLETTMTDNWTLFQQNEHGRELSTETKNNYDIGNDYELNRDADH